jgi:hypothetical protein
MNRITVSVTVLCLGAVAALGCSFESGGDAETAEQASHRHRRPDPREIARERAETYEAAVRELNDAVRDMVHERQSHQAIASMRGQIEELEAAGRFWRARAGQRR